MMTSYDNWKLATPPESEVDFYPEIEKCYNCDEDFHVSELTDVVVKTKFWSYTQKLCPCCLD